VTTHDFIGTLETSHIENSDKETSGVEKIVHQMIIENFYRCSICDEKFPSVNDLKFHQRRHKGEKIVCTVCGKQFSQWNDLKIHEELHTGEKEYQCELCGEKFLKIVCLQRHLVLHTGKKHYECGRCCKSFDNLGQLQMHDKLHNGKKRNWLPGVQQEIRA
jgi:KRAB domain-containing zinc finger protein